MLWQSIIATLQSNQLSQNYWESVILDALHLKDPCFALLPTEFFMNECLSIPESLLQATSFLLGSNFVPYSSSVMSKTKYHPLIHKAKLEKRNPAYGIVQLPNGRDLNVSLRDLVRAPDTSMLSDLPKHIMSHHKTAVANLNKSHLTSSTIKYL